MSQFRYKVKLRDFKPIMYFCMRLYEKADWGQKPMFPTGDDFLVTLMPQKVFLTKLSQEGPSSQVIFWYDATILGPWLWNQEGTLQ